MSKDFIEKYGKPGVHFPEHGPDELMPRLKAWGYSEEDSRKDIDKAIVNGDSSQRSAAIYHPHATEDHVEELAKINHPDVPYLIIRSPKTPDSVLKRFLHHPDFYVKSGIAQHLNASSETLEPLMRENRYDIKSAAYQNPNATDAQKIRALNEYDQNLIHRDIVTSNNVSKAVLDAAESSLATSESLKQFARNIKHNLKL